MSTNIPDRQTNWLRQLDCHCQTERPTNIGTASPFSCLFDISSMSLPSSLYQQTSNNKYRHHHHIDVMQTTDDTTDNMTMPSQRYRLLRTSSFVHLIALFLLSSSLSPVESSVNGKNLVFPNNYLCTQMITKNLRLEKRRSKREGDWLYLRSLSVVPLWDKGHFRSSREKTIELERLPSFLKHSLRVPS